MTDNERWQEICKPTLERIDTNVQKLIEVVITGDGKPSLTARVDALERIADGPGMRRKSIKAGPIEVNGYAMSDVVKMVILVALVACVWLLVRDRSERAEVLAKVKAITEEQEP